MIHTIKYDSSKILISSALYVDDDGREYDVGICYDHKNNKYHTIGLKEEKSFSMKKLFFMCKEENKNEMFFWPKYVYKGKEDERAILALFRYFVKNFSKESYYYDSF